MYFVDVTNIDLARLKAASDLHSRDWLHAASIASVGLKLTDEEIRIAVAQRLGARVCSPHTCVCGKMVDARGLHGVSCRKSAPRLNGTQCSMTPFGESLKELKYRLTRNQLVLSPKEESVRMVLP